MHGMQMELEEQANLGLPRRPNVEPERRTPQYVVGGRWPDGPAAIEV